MRSRLDVFNGIESAKLETSFYRSLLGSAYVAPVRRVLGTHVQSVKDAEGFVHSSKAITDVVWDIPICEQLVALIQHDPDAWQAIKSASARWSTHRPSKADVITDIDDGQAFLKHPKLGARSGTLFSADGEIVTKLGVKGYVDDIETANSLGYAAGKHKLCCMYASLVNLDPSVRDLTWATRS